MGFSNLKIPKICEQCQKPFEAKTITTRFCSHSCADKNGKDRKKKERELQKKEKVLEKYTDKIAVLQLREFISVSEAVVLFGISKSTIHRLIKRKIIHSVNLGERLTRINKSELETLFSPIILNEKENQEEQLPKKYRKEDCYTLSQVSEKFGANPSTVNSIIQRFKIQKEKIGNFVYVPKIEIDKIFVR
ncbi:helix-turn-helix domain-containing protein [Bergeyella zoohelcum]|uniref:helix-turn-helix transcriptional regulator n=1 Tax=Bergeyella zoohelcum TaxID=1015 RepID=UPI002A914793|nr:helix-turn-helix domain-containing protein [Bergeyella zoohelcum]MDY6026167.1 helix-turn-helix domain-containing protein [Bergeyella zoohelcum]